MNTFPAPPGYFVVEPVKEEGKTVDLILLQVLAFATTIDDQETFWPVLANIRKPYKFGGLLMSGTLAYSPVGEIIQWSREAAIDYFNR